MIFGSILKAIFFYHSMKRLSFILLFVLSCCWMQAQTIHYNVLDSVSGAALYTSNYMSYCTQGFHHKKIDEAHSLSLNFYSNGQESYYLLGMSLATPEPQDIKKGNRLRLALADGDTLSIRCLSDVTGEDRLTIKKDSVLWVTLPKYALSEKSVVRLLNEDVTAIYMELPNGKYVKTFQKDFRRWKWNDTLKAIYKALNKQKRDAYDVDLLYNNGQYKYISNDTVMATDKKVSFSDRWMY